MAFIVLKERPFKLGTLFKRRLTATLTRGQTDEKTGHPGPVAQ